MTYRYSARLRLSKSVFCFQNYHFIHFMTLSTLSSLSVLQHCSAMVSQLGLCTKMWWTWCWIGACDSSLLFWNYIMAMPVAKPWSMLGTLMDFAFQIAGVSPLLLYLTRWSWLVVSLSSMEKGQWSSIKK